MAAGWMIFDKAKSFSKKLYTQAPWVMEPLMRVYCRRKIQGLVRSGAFIPNPTSPVANENYERAAPGESIPKIFHQMWTHPPVPEKFAQYVASAKQHHPDPEWEYRLWDVHQMNALVRDHFPQYEEAYHALPTLMHQCDTFRHMMLAVHGGVYIDLDYLFYRPLDWVISDCRFCMTCEDDRVGVANYLSSFFIAGVPGHPYFLDAVAEVLDRPIEEVRAYSNPLHETGPELFTRVWVAGQKRYNAKLLRRVILSIPTEYHLGGIQPPEQAIGVHICTGTWR